MPLNTYTIGITELTDGSVVVDPSDNSQAWSGTGVFDKIIDAVNKNINIQYAAGRIPASAYGNVYAASINGSLQLALNYLFQSKKLEKELQTMDKNIETLDSNISKINQDIIGSQKDNLIKDYQLATLLPDEHNLKVEQKNLTVAQTTSATKQGNLLDKEIAIKNYENTTLQVDQHNVAVKQIAKADVEMTMLTEQKNMIVAQTAEIPANSIKQRAVQDGQIAQMTAETNYTNGKKTVMELSRVDNLLLETLKAQMNNLSTIGAGGLTPSATDFAAANSLRSAAYTRAQGGTSPGALPGISFTAGSSYIKAT